MMKMLATVFLLSMNMCALASAFQASFVTTTKVRAARPQTSSMQQLILRQSDRDRNRAYSPAVVLKAVDGDDATGDGGGDKMTEEKRSALEEKMMSWEATEEELKAASLGGVIPSLKKSDTDAFDIGLWIMFPFMIATGLLFGIFPFIMDKIDVSSVGPPPMI